MCPQNRKAVQSFPFVMYNPNGKKITIDIANDTLFSFEKSLEVDQERQNSCLKGKVHIPTIFFFCGSFSKMCTKII